MNIFEAIILGILQGLTEFIPVSSTAHLTIYGQFAGIIDMSHPERWTAFIAIIQLGTLGAVLLFFKKEIIAIPLAFFKETFKRIPFKKQTNEAQLGWLIIIGSIPVIVIALLFKDFIESSFTKNLNVIGVSLIVLALFLWLAEKTAKFKKDLTKITIKDSIIIGISQCFALIPGASRSGTTITGGLFSGLKRDDAARFSFLLGVPAIFGSVVLSFYEALEYVDSTDILNIIIATIFAGISGYWAIDFLIKFLKTKSTFIFVVYRIALGIGLLVLGQFVQVAVI